MTKILLGLWEGGAFPLKISHTIPLRYVGNLSSNRIMLTRRVSCVNHQLLGMIAHAHMHELIFCNACLVHLVRKRFCGRSVSPRMLEVPGLETLLVFLWKFPDLCRELLVVLPSLVEGNPITLVPNGRGFLLTAPPVEMLRERNYRVLALRGDIGFSVPICSNARWFLGECFFWHVSR